jgi:hypothetical protein
MLGFITERMPTKKITGINQTGDYVGVVTSSTGYRYIDTVVERKEISDLYGTLIPEDGRKRFYREIERFKMDERFNKMVIIVEGTLSDFVMYQPEFNAGEFDYGRRFDVNKNSTINEKKMTVLADLLVAGVLVMFCDNPTLAAQMWRMRQFKSGCLCVSWARVSVETLTVMVTWVGSEANMMKNRILAVLGGGFNSPRCPTKTFKYFHDR